MMQWRVSRFWQKIVIYFWAASVAGYVFEVVKSQLDQVIFAKTWFPVMPTILPLAPPYGFGVVALILLVIPLIRRFELHPAIVFVLAALVVSVVEFLCAVAIVLVVGDNQFWDYSAAFLNIHGFISAKSSLVFGILAIIFIYVLYPLCEKMLRHLSDPHLTILCWLLVGSYGADVLFLYIKWVH